MESQRNDMEQRVLSQLECPVCKEYMVPPIMLCANGHNICNVCKGKLADCPTCRQEFLKTRNMALENLAIQVKYPCTYRLYGCEETFSHDMIGEHQRKCRYIRQTCPVVKLGIKACSWTGRYSDLKKHLKEQHLDMCYEYSDRDYSHGQEFVLDKSTGNMCHGKFFLSYNEVFFHRCYIKNNLFHSVLHYIGPAENAVKYKYKVNFLNDDSTEGVTIMRLATSFAENWSDVVRSGNCLKLPYDLVSRFKNQYGDLVLKLEIRRVEDNL